MRAVVNIIGLLCSAPFIGVLVFLAYEGARGRT